MHLKRVSAHVVEHQHEDVGREMSLADAWSTLARSVRPRTQVHLQEDGLTKRSTALVVDSVTGDP